MISNSSGNTPPRRTSGNNITPSHAIPGSRPTEVTGEWAAEGIPCIVAITMGGPSQPSNDLMAHFATIASERHYHYQTISTGSNLPEAANVLQRIPRHARVVLIRTDASQDDITTLRAALPTEDIITGVDPLDPYDSNAWDALNNLSVARAAIAGAEEWCSQHSSRLEEVVTSTHIVSFFDPYRTNCVVELEASAADFASASLRSYLESLHMETQLEPTFDALFKGEDCFLVNVIRPSDLDENHTPGPRPLHGMPKGPIRAEQLMLLLENNHANALEALRPQLLAMPGAKLVKLLSTRAGAYRSPIGAAFGSGNVAAFRVLTDVMHEMKRGERLQVLPTYIRDVCDAYLNGRAAIINCFLDAAVKLHPDDLFAMHEAMSGATTAGRNYASTEQIMATRRKFGEHHFEKFDLDRMRQVEEKTAQVFSFWA